MKNNAAFLPRFILKPIVKLGLRYFYGRILTIGADNIPKDGAVIFAPNHQNALMDALLVITHSPTNPLSLARADVFKNPKIRKILTSLHMSPVFRQRDGVDVRTANEAIFERTTEELVNEGSLLVYPEGTHVGTFQVRRLKKGVARMALMAVNQSDIPVYVVPMGMNYSDHHHSGANVVLEFGKPIDVREKLAEVESETRLINELTLDLDARIRQLTSDIPDENYQNREDQLRLHAPLKVWDLDEMEANHRSEIAACNQWKAGEEVKWSATYETPSAYNFLRFSPLSYLAYWPSRMLYKKIEPSIKDPQFVSTAKYGFGLILTPTLSALWAALITPISNHNWFINWLLMLVIVCGNQTLSQIASSKKIKKDS